VFPFLWDKVDGLAFGVSGYTQISIFLFLRQNLGQRNLKMHPRKPRKKDGILFGNVVH